MRSIAWATLAGLLAMLVELAAQGPHPPDAATLLGVVLGLQVGAAAHALAGGARRSRLLLVALGAACSLALFRILLAAAGTRLGGAFFVPVAGLLVAGHGLGALAVAPLTPLSAQRRALIAGLALAAALLAARVAAEAQIAPLKLLAFLLFLLGIGARAAAGASEARRRIVPALSPLALSAALYVLGRHLPPELPLRAPALLTVAAAFFFCGWCEATSARDTRALG